jgi:WD40 repeat protein
MSLIAALFTALLVTQASTPAPSGQARLQATLQSFARADRFAVSKDSRLLAVGATPHWDPPRDYYVVLIELATRREIARTSVPGEVTALAFSHDGRWLAVAMRDRTVEIWTSDLTRRAHRFDALSSEPVAFVFAADDSTVVSVGSDGTCIRWDLTGGQPLKVMLGGWGDDGETHVAVSDDDRWLVTFNGHGQYEGRVVWLYRLGERFAARQLEQGVRTWGLAVSNDGRTIASAEGSLTLRDAATGTDRLVSIGKDVSAYQSAFSPDGHVLAVASEAGVAFVRVATGRVLRTIPPALTLQHQITYTPDGRFLLVSGHTSMAILDVQTGAQAWLSTWGFDTRLRFSSDGRRLVTRMGRQTRVWDTASWAERPAGPEDGQVLDTPRPRTGTRPSTRCVQLLASREDAGLGCDGDVRFSPAAPDGASVATIPDQTANVSDFSFSPHARWLAVAFADGVLRIFDLGAPTGPG